MAFCTDKAINTLNQLGYNVVKHPRTGIQPLDVIGSEGGNATHLGRLMHIWRSHESVPEIQAPRPAASINGTRSSELKLSVGLRVLAEVLGAMGATVPKVEFAYENADSVEFEFDDVQSVAVDPLLIGKFLTAGDLDFSNPFVTRFFFDEDTSAFVLSEVLTSTNLVVTAKDKKGGSVAIDVPAVKGVVGGSISVAASGTGGSSVKYGGTTPLAIGFKAFEIGFADGRWQVRGADHGMELESAATGSSQGPGDLTPVLLSSRGRRIAITSW